MLSEQERREREEFLRDTLQIAYSLVELITHYDDPFRDPAVEEIRLGGDKFRNFHPVCLFAAISFVDELAQIIKPKPIAEMPLEIAWVWEMKRVIELVNHQVFHFQDSHSKLVDGMVRRLEVNIQEERRKYEQP